MSYQIIQHENHKIPFMVENKTVYIDVKKCIDLIWPQSKYRNAAQTKINDKEKCEKRLNKLQVDYKRDKCIYNLSHTIIQLVELIVSFHHLPVLLRDICHRADEAQDLCENFIANTMEEIEESINKQIHENNKKRAKECMKQIIEKQTELQSLFNDLRLQCNVDKLAVFEKDFNSMIDEA